MTNITKDPKGESVYHQNDKLQILAIKILDGRECEQELNIRFGQVHLCAGSRVLYKSICRVIWHESSGK